ncbi:MAG: hypothetical protein IKG42_00115 [Clostridia bacterium]|nr:hypothetical protein [Clostridia bacterium]
MKQKTKILSSERDFRNYINSNKSSIKQILVFEDLLYKTIFFYCFCKDNLIVATKEYNNRNFSFYLKKYEKIAKKYNFSMSTLGNVVSIKNNSGHFLVSDI